MSIPDHGYNELERAFHEKDAVWLKSRRDTLNAQRKSTHEKAQHGPFWMVCPKCGGALKEEDFQGVMIDRCSACGGIYLDKGEFEMLAKAQQGGLKKLFGGH